MHCPKCGQRQISDETRFCSRCGFLLTGIATVVANDGILPEQSGGSFAAGSPRRRGVMQGIFIFLLSLLVVPVLTILTIFANARPFAVVISAILLTVGGLLRAIYALMFQSGDPKGADTFVNGPAVRQQVTQGMRAESMLTQGDSVPAFVPPGAGNWRNTNDLPVPASVTDSTTKLLANEKDAR